MNAVALQNEQNPDSQSLDSAIAVTRLHLYHYFCDFGFAFPCLLMKYPRLPCIRILDSEAATARLASLQQQMGHLSGMSSVSPQSGGGMVL